MISVLEALMRCVKTTRERMLVQQLHLREGRLPSDNLPPARWLEMYHVERIAKRALLARLIAGEWPASGV